MMPTSSVKHQGGAVAGSAAARPRTPSPARGSALRRPHETPVKTSRRASVLADGCGATATPPDPSGARAAAEPVGPPPGPGAAGSAPGGERPTEAAGAARAPGPKARAPRAATCQDVAAGEPLRHGGGRGAREGEGASTGRAQAEGAPGGVWPTEPAGTGPRPSGQASVQRSERVLEIVQQALRDPRVAAWADGDGYVPIKKLLQHCPGLQREARGSPRVVAHAVEGRAAQAVRLDRARRRVRLQTFRELLHDTAEAVLAAAPRGVVPLRAVLEAPPLREALAGLADPAGAARRALEHEQSPGVLRGEFVQRHPRGARLRKLVEELLSDENLVQDSRLRRKVAESPTGDVPLLWMCSRYASRLRCGADAGAAPGLEVSGAELCEALRPSADLVVDGRRLTVSRKQPLSQHLAAAGPGPSPRASAPSALEKGSSAALKTGSGAGRAAQQLRQLLDFYFEPFTLQHNRYLLDLLARSVGPPAESGPWVPDALRAFSCSLEDLSGLGRVSAALSKMHSSPDMDGLKHLSCDADGQLRLLRPPEVRSFVAAPGAPPGAFGDAVRLLTAAREERGAAPAGLVSVTSYAVADPLAEDAAQGPRRCARLKRQLLGHHTDLVCLQGLDPEAGGTSRALAEALLEEGYGYACSRDGKDANAIFWDRGRWELVDASQAGAAVAVALRPLEGPSAALRAVCLSPGVPCGGAPALQRLFGGGGGRRGPLVACADLRLLGGAECFTVAEELAGMSSVAQEVLGGEVLCPTPAAPGALEPLPCLASGLNRVRSPDAMLFEGMAPVAVLSGHTEGYLATLPADEVVQQFPAFRMPLVAAYSWHVVPADSSSSASDQRGLFRI